MDSEYFFSYNAIVAIFALLLAISIFIRALFYRKMADHLADDLRLTQQELGVAQAEADSLQRRHTVNMAFQEDLHEAEITMKLQHPRLSIQHGKATTATPERYLYVRSLAEKGMDAEEIASILQISIQEAQQLVNLSKLAAIAS